jgi:hypothetical protein
LMELNCLTTFDYEAMDETTASAATLAASPQSGRP